MSSAVFFQIQSTLILLFLFYGVTLIKKDRLRHSKVMKFCIIWDLLLVAQIELTREAVATAMEVSKNTWLLNFHITIAVSTVVLYLVMYLTGRKLLKGDLKLKLHHRVIAILTMVLRTSTYITSYLIETT